MMNASSEVKITKVETRYDGHYVRVYKEGGAWLRGDWSEWFLHADPVLTNGTWTIGCRTTCYGGRAASDRNVETGFADRPAAHARLLELLTAQGIEVPTEFLAHADWPSNLDPSSELAARRAR